MKITQVLLGEHGVFYAWFDAIEASLRKNPNAEDIRELAIVLAPALKQHAHMEDELLFDAMSGTGPAAGPLAMMHIEHERIEGLLENACIAKTAGEGAATLRDAIDTARDHFAKEERIVFPLAEMQLSGAQLEELAEKWADRRGVVPLARV